MPLPSLQGEGTPLDFTYHSPMLSTIEHGRGEVRIVFDLLFLPCRQFENGFDCPGRGILVFYGCLLYQTARSNSLQPSIAVQRALPSREKALSGLACSFLLMFDAKNVLSACALKFDVVVC